jgi:hypothetical protein
MLSLLSMRDGTAQSGRQAHMLCRPSAENANAETRGSADVICRTARSIAQGASDLDSFLQKRFPLAMPIENSWHLDPGPFNVAEKKDGHPRDSQPPASIGNGCWPGSTFLYNSSTGTEPTLRMRSKAASCMPSFQAGAHAPFAIADSLQVAQEFQVCSGDEVINACIA